MYFKPLRTMYINLKFFIMDTHRNSLGNNFKTASRRQRIQQNFCFGQKQIVQVFHYS